MVSTWSPDTDLNGGPPHYECSALTDLSYRGTGKIFAADPTFSPPAGLYLMTGPARGKGAPWMSTT